MAETKEAFRTKDAGVISEQEKYLVLLLVQIRTIEQPSFLSRIFGRRSKTIISKVTMFKGSFSTREAARDFIKMEFEPDQVWSITPALVWQSNPY